MSDWIRGLLGIDYRTVGEAKIDIGFTLRGSEAQGKKVCFRMSEEEEQSQSARGRARPCAWEISRPLDSFLLRPILNQAQEVKWQSRTRRTEAKVRVSDVSLAQAQPSRPIATSLLIVSRSSP